MTALVQLPFVPAAVAVPSRRFVAVSLITLGKTRRQPSLQNGPTTTHSERLQRVEIRRLRTISH